MQSFWEIFKKFTTSILKSSLKNFLAKFKLYKLKILTF